MTVQSKGLQNPDWNRIASEQPIPRMVCVPRNKPRQIVNKTKPPLKEWRKIHRTKLSRNGF